MSKVFELLSPHYTELKAEAAADYSAGDFVAEENSNVFPLVDVLTGANYAGILKAPKVRAAKAAVAIKSGDAVYYSSSTSNVSLTGTDVLVGVAIADALSGDAFVDIDFDGVLGHLQAVTDALDVRVTALEA